MKKILMLLFLWHSTCGHYVPPVLKRHTTGVCWHNSALQLLLAMETINNILIEDKQHALKKDGLNKYYNKADPVKNAYLDLVDAVYKKKQDQDAIDRAQKKLYSQVCSRQNITEGTQDDPRQTLRTIYYTFKDLFEKYTSMEYTLFDPSTKVWEKLKLSTLYFGLVLERWETNVSNIEQYKKEDLKKLPEYVILTANRDENNTVICTSPAYHFEKYYDLKAFIDAANAEGGHFWTWIETSIGFYKRDDMNLKESDAQGTASKKCPMYFLYKKIPGAVEKFFEEDLKNTMNDFGSALQSLV